MLEIKVILIKIMVFMIMIINSWETLTKCLRLYDVNHLTLSYYFICPDSHESVAYRETSINLDYSKLSNNSLWNGNIKMNRKQIETIIIVIKSERWECGLKRQRKDMNGGKISLRIYKKPILSRIP